MAQVNLLKKKGTYVDKETGEEKPFTNFFVRCGDVHVPIEVKYYEDKKTGRDPRYRERCVLLSAFAEDLPDRDDKKTASKKPVLEQDTPSADVPF